MTLRLRAVDLMAETEIGEFGAKLEFRSGLNVVSADNTKGKSTLVQAAIFAMGLEKMLSPRREVPLPRVMTLELREKVDGPEIPVLASRVMLEVQNGTGDVITLQRAAKGDTDLRLIRVFHGPRLSDPEQKSPATDYYALDPGAAQSSTGIHRFLADYLGWELPRVPRYSGGEAPLYLEAIFSLVFVEQKVGWSAMPANFPTYLGLKDMPRRAVEYVLGLRVNEVEVERQRIEARAATCRSRWESLVEEAVRLADVASGRVEGIPAEPQLTWDEDEGNHLAVPEDKGWVDVDELISHLTQRLRLAKAQPVPPAGVAVETVGEELQVVLQDLAELRGARRDLLSGLQTERAQLRATQRQLGAIEEDLQRHKDARKILDLGGEIHAGLGADQCPTCHQPVSDALLPPEAIDRPMSLEENQEFLIQQRDLFRNLAARSESLVEKREKELTRLAEQIGRLQARVRALQDTLDSGSATPSTAAIQMRVELEARIDTLKRVSAAFSKVLSDLVDVREDFRAVKADEAKLPAPGLPDQDKKRLTSLQRSIIEQLVEYGFTTFKPADIQLATDTYRPIREGFEIGFELSASDAIRLKWAYQLGLLEITRELPGAHHPGFLVFDEPRQQETSRVSFHQLIARASRVHEDLQVLFTTSEHKPTLREAIEGLELHFIDVPEYLLQPR